MKHRIVTAAQMKAIEQTGNAHGLPYLQMMENAGLAAYADCTVLETQHFDVVVDALYGAGFHGALRPSGLAACGLMNRLHKSGAFVLAVDLPSGI